MAHSTATPKKLAPQYIPVQSAEQLRMHTKGYDDVCLLWLPSCRTPALSDSSRKLSKLLGDVAADLGGGSTLIVVGDVPDLVDAHTALCDQMRYQSWIALKRTTYQDRNGPRSLPSGHFGATVYTKYRSSLHHVKTRVAYSYCPVCDRTTKDYGGKKHTYHEYGTLLSDVWTDIEADLDSDISQVIDRFADFLAVPEYDSIRVLDLRESDLERRPRVTFSSPPVPCVRENAQPRNVLLHGDALQRLRELPDNCVDFVFADPPYNLNKKYSGYRDDLQISEYFEWCDKWISELSRVLKPGRTCAILNIPLGAIRHFLFLRTVLHFQNWLGWDALSYPVRLLMPAHYAILCFSKGDPRPLPGLGEREQVFGFPQAALGCLEPMAQGFCLRAGRIRRRRAAGINDRARLTDLWTDIHRLKHNVNRVDHPCQLPPKLMYRVVSLFTKQGETVLDCFNGAGTTTLAAAQIGRKYIGIEFSKEYHELALQRHEEIANGLAPFRKEGRVLTAKNSPVARLPKQHYEVPKKVLQLEVKRIATRLGRLPTRDEVARMGRYQIKYYDRYFLSWGEVCAAARTTGMSEFRREREGRKVDKQLDLGIK